MIILINHPKSWLICEVWLAGVIFLLQEATYFVFIFNSFRRLAYELGSTTIPPLTCRITTVYCQQGLQNKVTHEKR